jgi:hypothetical protein
MGIDLSIHLTVRSILAKERLSMNTFKRELYEGKVSIRDHLQIEIKSEFQLNTSQKETNYIQDLYIFIPSTLDINTSTYAKDDFYRDQTSVIRYKTPIMSLEEILDSDNVQSPLFRLLRFYHKSSDKRNLELIKNETKLFGNICRSNIRNNMSIFIKNISLERESEKLHHYIDNLKSIFESYTALLEEILPMESDLKVKQNFEFTCEFLSSSIEYYLINLLRIIRMNSDSELNRCDDAISSLITDVSQHLESIQHHKPTYKTDSFKNKYEYVMYRKGLLNKFVLDALLLDSNRLSVETKILPLVGSFAAGIAMLFYFSLFVFQGSIFMINSTPFIMITILLYILKDRLKEGIKNYYRDQASNYFPDFTTHIKAHTSRKKLGKLREYFNFFAINEVFDDVMEARNMHSNEAFLAFDPTESVLFYKKKITLTNPYYKKPSKHISRRKDINSIFRFNFRRFIEKASSPYHRIYLLDPETKQIIEKEAPKVYHINIIKKETTVNARGEKLSRIEKYRLVIDKTGIKSVEVVDLE